MLLDGLGRVIGRKYVEMNSSSQNLDLLLKWHCLDEFVLLCSFSVKLLAKDLKLERFLILQSDRFRIRVCVRVASANRLSYKLPVDLE